MPYRFDTENSISFGTGAEKDVRRLFLDKRPLLEVLLVPSTPAIHFRHNIGKKRVERAR
jgi:hypothetical protein